LGDGDHLDLGGLMMRALAVPGHTPEHLAYLLLDSDRPLALFSGGSLLVGGVARTDLIDPGQTEALARKMWRALWQRALVLPDEVVVYPTHGAGSFCSAPGGGPRVTTIGRERAGNPLLAAADEDDFVRMLIEGLGTYPPYFGRLRELNRGGPVLYGPGHPVPAHLRALDVARLAGAGAWVVDARPAEAYARGHIPGSVSIALRPEFATWLGWVVPAGAPLVFVLEAGDDRAELVRQARNIGYETILGELVGGIGSWVAAGRPTATTAVGPVARASGRVLDVRQAVEFQQGHLPGAVNIELGSLVAADVGAGPLSAMCGHGERAMTAASLLARAGRADVTVLLGGVNDWHAEHGAALSEP
ncbi:MAG: rhodanese-like domain-containing protein, partial [Acidimicrobiales bacterium]